MIGKSASDRGRSSPSAGCGYVGGVGGRTRRGIRGPMPTSTSSKRRIGARVTVFTGKNGDCPTCTCGLIGRAAGAHGLGDAARARRTANSGPAQASARDTGGVGRLLAGR